MEAQALRKTTLPWLASELGRLRAAHAAGRLSHAILIHAPPGVGGEWLAAWVARLALCANQSNAPCDTCPSCRRVLELQHPDLTLVSPEEDSQQIRIEQVRALAEGLALTSHEGRAKVAILTPADARNPFAANALLKTLEEPPPASVLILVAAQPSRLPPTVRSRCQRLRLAAPPRAESVQWLERHLGAGDWADVLDTVGDAPLLAATRDPAEVVRVRGEVDQALSEALKGRLDAAATAEHWNRSGLALRLASFERWLTERLRSACAPSGESRELPRAAHLSAERSLLNIRGLFGLLDGVRELRSLLDTPINKSLAVEVLLRRLMAEVAASTGPEQRVIRCR
jgi:DNA polymerase-3 subunit delta'